MDKYNTVILMLLSLVLLCGCNQQSSEGQSSENQFYTTSRAGDLYRLPLIQPLELISADRGHVWFFKPRKQELSFSEVTKVGIQDSVIVMYSENTYFNSSMTNAWMVIDLKNKTEITIGNEEDYEKVTRESEDIKLWNVKEVFDKFDSENELFFKLPGK